MMTQPHDLGSSRHSRTWDHLKSVDCVPVLLSRIRSSATYFWLSFSQRALVGCAGKMRSDGMTRAIALWGQSRTVCDTAERT